MTLAVCNSTNLPISVNFFWTILNGDNSESCFSDIVFKIRLIRLGYSFQKEKNPVFERTTYLFCQES